VNSKTIFYPQPSIMILGLPFLRHVLAVRRLARAGAARSPCCGLPLAGRCGTCVLGFAAVCGTSARCMPQRRVVHGATLRAERRHDASMSPTGPLLA
jgi:hypothetical protein